MKQSPELYLVLDNCFAIKRWVRPAEWMRVAKEIGFSYVQASTDNEMDPLFSTEGYMDEWFREAEKAQRETGVTVANFFTGYQTYRTIGLAHHNAGMAEHLKQNWIFELMRRAKDLGAKGLGFSFWAIPEAAMQQPDEYKKREGQIIRIMQETAAYARQLGGFEVSFEQMYVPYQPPFTIGQTERYLQRVYEANGNPAYVTLDTGHMIGQAKYQKPTREQLVESFGKERPGIWLGSDRQYAQWQSFRKSGDYERGADEILSGMEEYGYLFAGPEDTDEYEWFRRLAKYSPIVHMQQTDGVTAGHVSFTPKANKTGIITGERLLSAIAESYAREDEIMPPAEKIYLSFELFYSNMATKYSIFEQLRETLAYWRRFIPRDGITLAEALKNRKA